MHSHWLWCSPVCDLTFFRPSFNQPSHSLVVHPFVGYVRLCIYPPAVSIYLPSAGLHLSQPEPVLEPWGLRNHQHHYVTLTKRAGLSIQVKVNRYRFYSPSSIVQDCSTPPPPQGKQTPLLSVPCILCPLCPPEHPTWSKTTRLLYSQSDTKSSTDHLFMSHRHCSANRLPSAFINTHNPRTVIQLPRKQYFNANLGGELQLLEHVSPG